MAVPHASEGFDEPADGGIGEGDDGGPRDEAGESADRSDRGTAGDDASAGHGGAIVILPPSVAATGAGTPSLPGCKSYGQRALVLAAFTPGDHTLRGLADNRDARVLAAALVSCGAGIEWPPGGVARVEGLRSVPAPAEPLDLDENGTGTRLLAPIVAMLGGSARFDGRDGLCARPMDAIVQVVERVGGVVSGSRLPLAVDGRGVARGPGRGELAVEASTTSQVASGVVLGLALAAARGVALPYDSVRAVGVRAAGYLAITVDVLRRFGWQASCERAGDGDVVLRPGVLREAPRTLELPVDASSAVWPCAFATLHGIDPASVGVRGGDSGAHPDLAAAAVFARVAGAAADPLTFDDLGGTPDLFPALAIVCALGRPAGACTVLRGAPALRHKESDRVAAMADGLRQLGVSVRELPDGIEVEAVGVVARTADGEVPVVVTVPPDHRIVMAFALAGTRCPSGVRLAHAEAVDKSWPGFWSWLAQVARVERADGGV